MPLKRLAPRAKFGQRHFTFRTPTPYLKALGLETQYRRSGVTTKLILQDILKYDKPDLNISSVEDSDLNFKLAVALTCDAFTLPSRVKMLHLNDVFDYDLPIWSSSPGLPWRDLGYKTKRSVVVDDYNRQSIRWFWHKIKNTSKLVPPDCLAFVRSHLTTGADKVRAVWGYPMTVTCGEAVFAVPLIEAYKSWANSPMAYGYESSVGGFKRLLTQVDGYKQFTAIDFKDFDKSVQRRLIHLAFDILMRNVDFVNYRDRGIADATRNMRMWYHLVDYFIHTPIRLCTGERFRKSMGVASGSYFTQLIDSIVNHILITWIYLDQTGFPPRWMKVLGDDSLAAGDFIINLDRAADLVGQVGMVINFQKSSVSCDVNRLQFLGFKINNGLPTKSFEEWVALLTLPENLDTCWDHVATRALGLLYANSGVDPTFDKICRYIINIQPFDIMLSRSMARYLHVVGIDEFIKKEPPDPIQFLRRLKMV